MKTIEAIWLASVALTVIGCIYWQWRVREHQKAAQELADKIAIRFIDPERSKETCRRMMVKYDEVFRRLAEVERKELIHSRCLANSTRPRHSRSTLRKTR